MKRIIKVTEKLNNAALLSFLLVIFLVFYFFLFALRSTPDSVNELDSLGQHIPLAESILKGNIFNPPVLGSGIGYYMPLGEAILAMFIVVGLPLGLYNVIAIIILSYLCIKLGERMGLGLNSSVVYAFSISFLNTITRLVPTQKNDLYLNVFFVWFLYLLINPNKKLKHYLILGISGGLLIGVKYSGIILAGLLLVIFSNNIKKNMNSKDIVAFSIPIFLLGFIWYFRNYTLTGNPFYPVSLLGFKGNPNYIVPRGYESFLSIKSFTLTLEAIISEYLVWSIVPIYIIFTKFRNKVSKLPDIRKLLLLSGISSVIYFFGPTDFTRVNITSNMRFLQPAFIILILAIFLIAKQLKKEKEIITLSILSSIMILSQLSFYPKLIIIWLMFIMFLILKMNRLKNISI